jgi:hypothetical protein
MPNDSSALEVFLGDARVLGRFEPTTATSPTLYHSTTLLKHYSTPSIHNFTVANISDLLSIKIISYSCLENMVCKMLFHWINLKFKSQIN